MLTGIRRPTLSMMKAYPRIEASWMHDTIRLARKGSDWPASEKKSARGQPWGKVALVHSHVEYVDTMANPTNKLPTS